MLTIILVKFNYFFATGLLTCSSHSAVLFNGSLKTRNVKAVMLITLFLITCSAIMKANYVLSHILSLHTLELL